MRVSKFAEKLMAILAVILSAKVRFNLQSFVNILNIFYQKIKRQTCQAEQKKKVSQPTTSTLSQNLLQNILAFFHLLSQLSFTMREIEINCYHQILNVGVASQVANQLQTWGLRKFGNFRKLFKLDADVAQCPASFTEIKIWQQCQKIKKNVKVI